MGEKQHDGNGVNGYCIAFWDGLCSIRGGPRVCPSQGDANQCFLKKPELYTKYYKGKIRQGLTRIIRENLRNPSRVDINEISIEIMRKFSIRLKNNNEE